MKDKITIAIAGLGSRGRTAYGAILLDMKDRAQVVAIADFDKTRCEIAQKEHNVKSENVFSSVEEMLSKEKLADAVLICTQDRDHVRHALMALDKGYDILLEKPVSPDLNELKSLVKKSKETGRKVLVCHVLRYTPFFQTIKKAIDSGRIGKVATVQALENVRYWHQAHSFVRGNWRRKDETSPMILAKCCHDLDYLIWLILSDLTVQKSGYNEIIPILYGTNRIAGNIIWSTDIQEVQNKLNTLLEGSERKIVFWYDDDASYVDEIDNLEKLLAEELGCLATIHMDPIVTNDPRVNELKEKVKEIVLQIQSNLNIHDFRVVWGETHTNLIFDILAPFDLKYSDEELTRLVEENVKQKVGDHYCTVIDVDKDYNPQTV